MSFKNIIIELRGGVGLITLNRPENNNALSVAMFSDLTEALDQLESNAAIGAIVITGSDKVFAAGADLTEIKDKNYIDVYNEQFITAGWERITTCRKPVIAATAGYVLGGGCEIAMMCDFIIAAENALFGQPEIKVGTIPGAGGTQRLTRLVGKSKAMEMCLTGRMMDAEEAERAGLVSRIVPVSELVEEVMKTADKIASMSRPAVMMAKKAVNASQDTSLSQGIQMERSLFYSTFSLDDQKEGMAAFVEKRKPEFKNK
jgi:enoyl-CoA hydratase